MVRMDKKLEVKLIAPKRASLQLSFGVWMALAKSIPVQAMHLGDEISQALEPDESSMRWKQSA